MAQVMLGKVDRLVNSAPEGLWKEDHGFKASLDHMASLRLA